ncbi:MAG: type IV pilus twitching motility protein PilT [Deltaproteobacteria bacterium]|nr:MAG: type IV pilus twitching motility protein PilT [Deltaproteobacteria bacterium]
MPSLNELLGKLVEMKGSDLHLTEGSPPQLRLDGYLHKLEYPAMTGEEVKNTCYELLSYEQKKTFEKNWELDLSFELKGIARFRANIYWQKGHVAAAYRIIPIKMPDPKEIGLPQAAIDLTKKPRGMVLVTGPTGSGKSTTLASMINLINMTRHDHIVTVEDPIEFVHEHKNCFVTQREIGQDSHSFTDSLKYVLRQDPDVILIGEMRDLETIAAAITISETGHLVFATLHTNSAVQTINRVIDVFPSNQQAQVRTQLSFILEGVLSQQLLPKIGGGRCLGLEVMIPTPAIRNLIREDKVHQIYSQMQMGRQLTGMQTMNQCLVELVKSGKLEKEIALSRCTDMEEFKKLCP